MDKPDELKARQLGIETDGIVRDVTTFVDVRELLDSAQKVYDDWQQDVEGGSCGNEELNGGGICHLIADAMIEVLAARGFEAVSFHASIGENHVWANAQTSDGVFRVDIPPDTYETGGGYTWFKVPDVELDARDVLIEQISPDPADFDEYLDDY